jgi:hypothetical protein
MNITAATKISNLTTKELNIVVKEIVYWCFDNLKQPKRHRTFGGIKLTMPVMHVFISRKRGMNLNPKNNFRGEYNPFLNQIVIMKNNIDSLDDLIDTIIHEYTHSTQALGRYMKLNQKHGYWENPLEVEARMVAALNMDNCMFDVCKSLNPNY